MEQINKSGVKVRLKGTDAVFETRVQARWNDAIHVAEGFQLVVRDKHYHVLARAQLELVAPEEPPKRSVAVFEGDSFRYPVTKVAGDSWRDPYATLYTWEQVYSSPGFKIVYNPEDAA